MANNLIKWWKTKFMNKYKQLSGSSEYEYGKRAAGGGGRGRSRGRRMSDTHKLLESDLSTSDLYLRYSAGSVAGGGATGAAGAAGAAVADTTAAVTANTSDTATNHLAPHSCDNLPTYHKHQLNVQNFSYVSMQGESDQCTSERQEFSFTLYDFDGHGKITKDDITGLVTTIYETIKSCVQLPYYGSKTIKVKLIISPNQRKQTVTGSSCSSGSAVPAASSNPASTTTPNTDEQICEDSKKHDSCFRNGFDNRSKDVYRQNEACRKEKKHRKDFYCNFIYEDIQNDPCYEVKCVHDCGETVATASHKSVHRNKSEAEEDSYARSGSDVKRACVGIGVGVATKQCKGMDSNTYPSASPSLKHGHHIHPHTHAPAHSYQQHDAHSHLSICPRLAICPLLCTKAWRTKHRSGSLQRQQLLKIIQANMDKNNLRFETSSRKRCSNEMNQGQDVCAGAADGEPVPMPSLRSGEHNPTIKLRDLASMMSSNNYLVNLSSLQTSELYKTNRSKSAYIPYCEYDTAALLNAVVNMNKHVLLGRHRGNVSAAVAGSDLNHSTVSHYHCKCKRQQRFKNNDFMQIPLSYRFVATKRHALNKRNCIFNNEFMRRPKVFDKNYTKSKYSDSKFEQFPQRRSSKKISRVFLGHSPSPHHLKHRNRKEDQARAMAQVVRWLEKEVSTNISFKARLEKRGGKSRTFSPEKRTPMHSKVNSSSSVRYVQKHEHHHVHKHIHHHYHHFQRQQEAC